MNDDLIEKYAIRVALGNNGGTWATHYTEDQKEHWRQFIRDLIEDMSNEDVDQHPFDRMFGVEPPVPHDKPHPEFTMKVSRR